MSDDHEASESAGGRNLVSRERLRQGAVECPLCGRQLAAPELVAFGSVEPLTAETADAVECSVCGGVSFLVEE